MADKQTDSLNLIPTSLQINKRIAELTRERTILRRQLTVALAAEAERADRAEVKPAEGGPTGEAEVGK